MPGDPAQAHAFLQRRVSIFIAVTMSLFAAAYVIGVVLTVTSGGSRWFHPLAPRMLAHLGAVAFLGMLLVFARTGRPSVTALGLCDRVATLGQVMLLCFMFAGWSPFARPELSLMLGTTNVLVLRAALVPDTPRGAATLGVLATLPTLVMAWALHRTVDARPEWLPPTSLAVAAVGVWALVATIGSTTIAWIIYGLREHVRAAMELGQYTLLEKIGEGGMGVVFKARHTLLRRPTAVKILRAEGARETSFARFEREVQLTSEISHPNVVSVYDFGRSADGDFYYAMEYLDGIDLERLVEQYGRQPAARVVHVMRQAADALAEAHAVGLIHRDVKPANMILCDHPRRPDLLKVVDFGLVKDLSSRDPVLSDENVLTGTPLYMAPEAISAPEQLDARGDIYALGAVGYFLLTGTPPFSGRTVIEVLGQHLHGTVIPPSAREGVDVPHDLETLILSCLAKSPAERPQSAAAVVAALRNCGDIAAWDHVDARAWWAEREATPRKTSDHREAMTRTLAVMPRTALEHTTPANERALGR